MSNTTKFGNDRWIFMSSIDLIIQMEDIDVSKRPLQ